MALIIVGGQAKNVGKTTLICNILSAFPDVKWTAVKVSNHRHATESCDLLGEASGWRILQQNLGADYGDTGRFLKSGAARALLVQTDDHSLKEACSLLLQEIAMADAVIVESASAAEFLRHDLLLLLLDSEKSDFKTSASEQLDRADAFVIRGADSGVGKGLHDGSAKPVFKAFPNHLDSALLRMLDARIKSSRQRARGDR